MCRCKSKYHPKVPLGEISSAIVVASGLVDITRKEEELKNLGPTGGTMLEGATLPGVKASGSMTALIIHIYVFFLVRRCLHQCNLDDDSKDIDAYFMPCRLAKGGKEPKNCENCAG